jgi:uracil-DNA glycosylase family 4
MIYPPDCTRCKDLVSSRRKIVWGSWVDQYPDPSSPTVMYIGEAPGEQEDRQGRPFVGNTGAEVRQLLWRHGLTRHTYLTNIVKCHPKNDRDPTPDEIRHCNEWLQREIAHINPSIIITAGRYSTWWALGDDAYTMEMVTGIPYHSPVLDRPVLPMIHPAAGFHSQKNMSYVVNAFDVAGKLYRGEIDVQDMPRPSSGSYMVAHNADDVSDYLFDECHSPSTIAIDTESGHDGTWCLTVSGKPSTAIMIRVQDQSAMSAFQSYLSSHNPLCVIHSALYDLPELASVNIHPQRIHDTMTMAYLLQDEPLGLKPLAWRIANVKMDSYVETIWEARWKAAMRYLAQAVEQEWPDPEPLLVWVKGEPKAKQPQNIGKKITRILGDISAEKKLKDGTPVHPRKRWLSIGLGEGRGMVEEKLGPMPDGFLCDVPLQTAVAYACCDADMTLRIYPHLFNRLDELNMTDLINEESGVTQFINLMHDGGLPCDREHFTRVAEELDTEMTRIEMNIIQSTGQTIQLSSHQQVSSLLYDHLGLRKYLPKRTKKSGATMTGDDILAQIEPHHPVITMIRDWRKCEKLKNTYACGVPTHIQPDGRVHADFRNTNTDTGRLSGANPNLMAQPKRNKVWAKKIRNGFYAPDGWKIVSMDYSQIELRVLAEEANEQSMIDAFRSGIDLHTMTASEMFDVEMDDVDKLTQRLPAKTINFGIVYGISAAGLYRNMATVKGCEHWTQALAQQYIDLYLQRRPGINDYIRDTISMAKRYGRVWDWAGRIRRIPGARLVSEYNRAEAERQACNARIQTGAQSVIKRAMSELYPVYMGWRDMGYDVWPAIQIHDDIVSMVPDDLIDVLVPVQRTIMETVHTLKSGIRVDVEIGQRWGDMHDYER